MKRVLTLPAQGKLLISTDMHGNYEDLRRLTLVFEGLLQKSPDSHWVILGDAVHGPSPKAAEENPRLYGYPDESWRIIEALISLTQKYPAQVHFVIGNHDYGHLGGYRTSKFYPDEVRQLESTLRSEEKKALWAFLEKALVAVVAPCGAFLAHGSPEDCIQDLSEVEALSLPAKDLRGKTILRSFLTSYGQPTEICDRLLQTVSRAGTAVRFVIHGHDKDEAGFFFEGGNQLCPVLFGAPNENKRYVLLELSAQYQSVAELREEHEILRLYERPSL